MALIHKGEKTIWGCIILFSLLMYLCWNIFTLFEQIQELIFSTIPVNLGVVGFFLLLFCFKMCKARVVALQSYEMKTAAPFSSIQSAAFSFCWNTRYLTRACSLALRLSACLPISCIPTVAFWIF